ncbi:MAG: isochorismatase family protein [Candidatus Tectimicrobiota bacterium]
MDRHPYILSPEKSAFVLIDLQTNLLKAMDPVLLKERLANVRTLIELAKTFEVPVLVTEQYPEGLGTTDEAVVEALPVYEPVVKNSFSAGVVPATLEAIAATGATDLVIVGAEAHVCVLQTTLDLLYHGYRCHVVEDAIISRRDEHRLTAVELARQAGALVKVTEMVCFEMLERAGTEAFKTMLRWIK